MLSLSANSAFYMHMQVNPPLGKRTIRDWKRMELVVEPGIQISDDAQK